MTSDNDKLSSEDLIKILDGLIDGFERIPEHAKSCFVTNYEMQSVLILLSSIFKSLR